MSKKIPDKNKEFLNAIFNDSSEAAIVARNDTPKYASIFLLLPLYFGEDTSFLFRVVSVSLMNNICISFYIYHFIHS